MGASLEDMCLRDGESPVGLAAYGGHEMAVRTLLARGARADKPNYDGYTPVHWAAQEGYDGILRDVLNYGADVNAETKHAHFTPLHLAAAEGRTETVRVLLQHGADLTRIARMDEDEDGEEWTPAETAKENGFLELGHLMDDWVKLLGRFKSLAANPWQVELRLDV
jgi:ankyrin repeat protein